MTEAHSTSANGISELIKERRSVKLFKQEPLPEGLLEELLNVAVWAPNHGLREPWRFIAFQGDGAKFLSEAAFSFLKRAITDPDAAAKRKEYISNIPLTLIVVMPEDPRQRESKGLCCGIGACTEFSISCVGKRGWYHLEDRSIYLYTGLPH